MAGIDAAIGAWWKFYGLIALIAELRREACFGNGLLYGEGVHAVLCACRRNHVFFYHYGAQIVCASVQANLGRLAAHSEPRCLYVVDIVQHNAANGHRADIFFGLHGAVVGVLGQRCALPLKCP